MWLAIFIVFTAFLEKSFCQSGITLIRLVGGNESQGRVELFYNSQWGTICSDGWDDFDANVICRMRGYNGISKAVVGRPDSPTQFGPGSGPIHMRSVNCDGNEDTILNCRSQLINVSLQCTHMEDAGVMCYRLNISMTTITRPPWILTNPSTLPPKICSTPNPNIELRLSNNSASQSGAGRIMYFKNNIWKGVCNNHWGQNEAYVVCRMLCYNPIYSVPIVVKGLYGNVSNEGFWLTGVKCQGSEFDLSECETLNSGANTSGCTPEDVAAVNCLGNFISAPRAITPWVDCSSSLSMIVIFNILEEPRLRPQYFSVINSTGSKIESCPLNATMENDLIYVSVPLFGCNTTRKVNNTSIIYSNYISYTLPPTSEVITRSDTRILMVSCVLDRSGVDTDSYRLLPIDLSQQFGRGLYDIRLMRYTDSRYTTVSPDKGFPVNLNDWIFAEVQLFTEDKSLILILDSVLVSLQEQSFDNDTVYYLISNRCAVDDTTTLIPYNETVVRFRFQSLRMVGHNSTDVLYIHTETHVCDENETTEVCARGCPNDQKIRYRRSERVSDKKSSNQPAKHPSIHR